MRSPHAARGLSRTALVASIAIVALGAGLVLAVPRFLGPPEEPDLVQPDAPAAAVVPAPAPAPTKPAEPAAPTGPVATEGGDLVLELKLRWEEVVAGANLPATVRFVNTGLTAFELPSAGEPHPTLALVVLDAEGNEVRRVVETGPEPYPRRTTSVPSAGAMELQALVVSGDDRPLAPGAYTVYAEMRRDPAWARLGIPLWSAPKGPVRSTQVPLRVTAKPE